MKFSKDISKAVTSVMALFQKQLCCAESLRRVPVRHNREGVATESKVQFVPPTMCRLTVFRLNGTACTLQLEGCPLQTGSF